MMYPAVFNRTAICTQLDDKWFIWKSYFATESQIMKKTQGFEKRFVFELTLWDLESGIYSEVS